MSEKSSIYDLLDIIRGSLDIVEPFITDTDVVINLLKRMPSTLPLMIPILPMVIKAVPNILQFMIHAVKESSSAFGGNSHNI